MSSITLTTELTPDGVVCSNETLGKVATIVREFQGVMGDAWFVRPYGLPIYERGVRFKSYQAAEYYALAIAHEMHETKERQ